MLVPRGALWKAIVMTGNDVKHGGVRGVTCTLPAAFHSDSTNSEETRVPVEDQSSCAGVLHHEGSSSSMQPE